MPTLKFKNLQQQSFTLEVEDTATIASVKESIQQLQNYEVSTQKLIYKGKILADDALVESLGFVDNQFIVVMVTKPKTVSTPVVAAPAPAPVTPATTTTTTTTAATPSAPSTAPVVPATAETPAVTAGVPAPVAAAFDSSTLATGENYETAVSNLVEMGFPRDQVAAAMRAAFNNPDRAADYLFNGIPDSARREPAGSTPASATATATPATTTTPAAAPAPGQYVNLFDQAAAEARAAQAAPATAARGGNELDFLRTSPQFQQLRQVVHAQPHMLQTLLQQIGQSQPQLMQIITANREQFMEMLMEGAPPQMGMEQGAAGGEEYITITPEEDAAVNRLVSLGFDREAALVAYFACEKNEELAANFLFDNGGE